MMTKICVNIIFFSDEYLRNIRKPSTAKKNP